jgi:sugar/nucleoside kinase (ribokinase family)
MSIVDGAVLRVAAPRVHVVDTTGAGDAFNGGFLAACVAGQPVHACLRAGVRLGSRSTGAAGGLDGLPSRGVASPLRARGRR